MEESIRALAASDRNAHSRIDLYILLASIFFCTAIKIFRLHTKTLRHSLSITRSKSLIIAKWTTNIAFQCAFQRKRFWPLASLTRRDFPESHSRNSRTLHQGDRYSVVTFVLAVVNVSHRSENCTKARRSLPSGQALQSMMILSLFPSQMKQEMAEGS